MADNEIIKVLEYCLAAVESDDLYACDNCPAAKECENGSLSFLKATIDLLNRYEAEIERLSKEVDRLSQCVLYHDGQITDAIKEFAERLKNSMERYDDEEFYATEDDIDNLVKEMTEQRKEDEGK